MAHDLMLVLSLEIGQPGMRLLWLMLQWGRQEMVLELRGRWDLLFELV